MLQLKKITKIYKIGELEQTALDNVSISFRSNEFAAILGPSGSGKTTLLNIIGGLDQYSNGDLLIDNISTKKYKDSDWDSYRNHRIGFVFQNYNLIQHQNVLQNVILALTLSGISKKESIEKAITALKEVGLEEHIYKKPNQLSGGQMQRVAIARALVNDPDILLADEPTGALDTETSLQIMELLKKISKNKLVIMVTHNPDLAEKYSTRTIMLKDGKITSDTNPYEILQDKNLDKEKKYKKNKTSMSFITALSLSFNNLMTKKARTILVSFAGSIGIIGIALILSLSTGFQRYIDKIQEDTLSSYPLTITSTSADMSALLLSMMSNDSENISENKVVEKQFISSMFSNITTNDLKSFKTFLNNNQEEINKNVSSIKYSYSIDPLIYTKLSDGKISKVNPNTLFTSLYGSNSASSLYSTYSSVFSQITDDKKSLEEQYDILTGSWPEKYDEIIIVLNQKNSIPDLLLYFLGLRDIDELYDIMSKTLSGESVDVNNEPLEFTYNELMNIELKLFEQNKMYKFNSKYNIYEDMSEDSDYVKQLYDEAVNLKVVGIVAPKSGTTSMALTPGIAYTSELIKYIVDNAYSSEIVKKQLEHKEVDVFTNTRFDDESYSSKTLDFENMLSVDTKALESAFNINIDEKTLKNKSSNYIKEISDSITSDISPAKEDFISNFREISINLLNDYIENPKTYVENPLLPENKIATMCLNDVDEIVSQYFSNNSVIKKLNNLESKYVITQDIYSSTYQSLINVLLKSYILAYYSIDQSLTADSDNPVATILPENISDTVDSFINQSSVQSSAETFAQKMTEAKMQKTILTKVGELTNELVSSLSSAFDIDKDKISKAFKFNMSEDELKRVISTMLSQNNNSNASTNLSTLGYQDEDDPSMISIYFKSFDSKEEFLDMITEYNDNCEKNNEEDKIINYTDTTGILMSSVKKVINSVSYVLIAFVSISLVVSSIMIGIITYISVLERTKEIGVLRAIGASKSNVSSIFNAETFIIGLLSGLIGIGFSLSLIPIINHIIHNLTNNLNISAYLPISGSIILIVLSIILTIIGGLIPAKKASKQNPVIALRSE